MPSLLERKYGKDFKATAEVIGTKTELHVRSFFVNYRRRYNLDEVHEEFLKENGGHSVKQETDEQPEEKMEVDDKTELPSTTDGKVTTNGVAAASVGAAPPPLVKQQGPSTSAASVSTSGQ